MPLANNAAQRSVRRPVVGRKNFAGCKSVRGTAVAAVLDTLLESAELVGVEPRNDLRAAVEAALTCRPPLLPRGDRDQLRAGGDEAALDGCLWRHAAHRGSARVYAVAYRP